MAGDECDICFDAALEVAIRGCGHQLCAGCLRGVRLPAPAVVFLAIVPYHSLGQLSVPELCGCGHQCCAGCLRGVRLWAFDPMPLMHQAHVHLLQQTVATCERLSLSEKAPKERATQGSSCVRSMRWTFGFRRVVCNSVACLAQVCEATPDKTPRCPFCRRVVDCVVPAAPKQGLLASGAAVSATNKPPPPLSLDDICNAAIAVRA